MTFQPTAASHHTDDNHHHYPHSGCAPIPADLERVWTLAEQARMAEELAGLRQRLATLPVIEQSKGLLMAHYGIDADTAFTVLRRWSSHSNLKLRVISRMLVDAATETDPRHGLTEIIHSLQDTHPSAGQTDA